MKIIELVIHWTTSLVSYNGHLCHPTLQFETQNVILDSFKGYMPSRDTLVAIRSRYGLETLAHPTEIWEISVTKVLGRLLNNFFSPSFYINEGCISC